MKFRNLWPQETAKWRGSCIRCTFLQLGPRRTHDAGSVTAALFNVADKYMEYQVMDEPSHVWIHRKNMFPGKIGVETQPINMINMVLAYLIGYPSIFAGFILHSLIQSARNWWVHHLSLALPLADRRRPHHGPTVGSWSQLTYSSGVGRHNGSETMAIPKSCPNWHVRWAWVKIG